MIIKQVKEYGTKKRKRIDINQSDNLEADTEVALQTMEEYDKIKNKLLTMQDKISSLTAELEVYQKQELNLKEIVEENTAPIHKFYKEELDKKDNKINELEAEIKELYTTINDFKLDMMGLNGFEILLFRRHKKRIRTFDADLKLISDKPNIVDTDIVPGGVGSSDNQE